MYLPVPPSRPEVLNGTSSKGAFPKGGGVDKEVPVQWPLDGTVEGISLYL